MKLLRTSLLAFAAGCMLSMPVRAEPITLNMIILPGADSDGMQLVADAYQKTHPDVTIKLQSYPWDQFFQTAELRLNSKDSSIDLVYVDAPLVASYASRGFLKEIDPSVDVSSLVPSSAKAGTYDGKRYALPINNSAQLLFYNKKLFEDAGVTPPAGLSTGSSASQDEINTLASTKRWTWEQVIDAAKKLTVQKSGRTVSWGFCFDQVNEIYQLQPLGESLGTDVISADGSTAKGYLDSPAWQKAGKFYSDIYNDWKVCPKGLGHDESRQLFAAGQLALFAGGVWNLGIFAKTDVDFGVAAYPYFEGGKVLTPTGSWFIGVSANSDHADAALDFAEFLTISQEGTHVWFDAVKQLPASKPLLAEIGSDPAFDKFPQNMFRIGVYDALNTAKPRPTTVAFGQLQDAFRTAFEDISNGIPVDEALATAVQTYDRAVERVMQK